MEQKGPILHTRAYASDKAKPFLKLKGVYPPNPVSRLVRTLPFYTMAVGESLLIHRNNVPPGRVYDARIFVNRLNKLHDNMFMMFKHPTSGHDYKYLEIVRIK